MTPPTPAIAAENKITPSARRLNQLAMSNGALTYLEVGVQTGITFFNINVRHKVAVDPVFKFAPVDHAGPDTEFHQITSDEYFAGLRIQQKFDLIFLDGLHTFEQTLRDFCNTLSHCHDRTIWIIDDTYPSDIYSAHKVQSAAVGRRLTEVGDKRNRAWHGDVYKTMFAIHDFFPGMSYCTFNTGGHKQSVLWQQKRSHSPRFNDLERISRLDYFDFLRHLEVLNPLPEPEALQLVVDYFDTLAERAED